MLDNLGIPNPFAKENQEGSESQQEPNKAPPKVPGDTENHLENRHKEQQKNPEGTDMEGGDRWASLYDNADDDGEGADPEPTFSMESKGFTKKNISELASKMNVNLPADEEITNMFQNQDVDAFKQMLNGVARDSLQYSMIANAQGTDSVLKDTSDHVGKMSEKAAYASQVKNTVNETLSEEYPKQYSQPGFKNNISEVQQKILKKYPDATPKQVSSMVQGYLKDVYGLEPKSKTQEETERRESAEPDWFNDL